MLKIKVGTMLGEITPLEVSEGTVIAQAVEHAGLTTEGYEIRHNGAIAKDSDLVKSGSIILLVEKVKGNAGVVKVGTMLGEISPIAHEEGMTAEDAVTRAGLSADGYEVRLNGAICSDMNTTIKEGAIILLVEKVKGNEESTCGRRLSLVTLKFIGGEKHGQEVEINFDAHVSLKNALAFNGIDAENYEIIDEDGLELATEDILMVEIEGEVLEFNFIEPVVETAIETVEPKEVVADSSDLITEVKQLRSEVAEVRAILKEVFGK